MFDPQTVFQMGLSDAVVCCDSRSDTICLLPGANPRVCNCPPTITGFSSYLTIGVIQGITDLSPTLHCTIVYIDTLIWPKDFELWFLCSKDLIPLLYCSVFVRLGQLEPCYIVLLPQQWCLDSNSESFPHSWHIFCITLVQLCSNVWRTHASGWLWWNFPLLSWLLLVYYFNKFYMRNKS